MDSGRKGQTSATFKIVAGLFFIFGGLIPGAALTIILGLSVGIPFLISGIKKANALYEEDLLRMEEVRKRQEIRRKERNCFDAIGPAGCATVRDIAGELGAFVKVTSEKIRVKRDIIASMNLDDVDEVLTFAYEDKVEFLLVLDYLTALEDHNIKWATSSVYDIALKMLYYGFWFGTFPLDENSDKMAETLDSTTSKCDDIREMLLRGAISTNGKQVSGYFLEYYFELSDTEAGQKFHNLLNLLVSTAMTLSGDTVSVKEEGNLSDSFKKLGSLIGLSPVKKEVQTLANLVRINQLREQSGFDVPDFSYHCVFTGNPGTGKTTVARIVAEIYKELGVLKKGHLVETDRSGLVAEYLGQTAAKTNKVIDSALDGVLFIDEAYSLAPKTGYHDYGTEAIATLLKRMEDDRQRLVVIVAGYSEEMKSFIDANPGLQSRFTRYIEFPDYSVPELFDIYTSYATKYQLRLQDDTKQKLFDTLTQAYASKDRHFGNGRFVRNLFEKTLERQANRLSAQKDISPLELATIVPTDFES